MSVSVGAYSVHAALQRALQISSTFGQVTTRQQIEGDVSRLVLALPTPSCALTFALNLDLTGATFEFPYGAALTTFYKDANAQYCSATVYKDTSGAMFLHKDVNSTWRVGTSLGGGSTILSSVATGGREPPSCDWCAKDGNLVEELYLVDSIIWSSLCLRVAQDPSLADPREHRLVTQLQPANVVRAAPSRHRASSVYDNSPGPSRPRANTESCADRSARRQAAIETAERHAPKAPPPPKADIRVAAAVARIAERHAPKAPPPKAAIRVDDVVDLDPTQGPTPPQHPPPSHKREDAEANVLESWASPSPSYDGSWHLRATIRAACARMVVSDDRVFLVFGFKLSALK